MGRNGANSRKTFLKSGLLAGGALYATPAAAIAMTGGRRFFDDGVDQLLLFPKKSKIGEWITGLNDNAGNLTLSDLSGLALTSEKTFELLYKQFPNLTFGDLGDIMSDVISGVGGGTPIITIKSGKITISSAACCCCCCGVATTNPW